MKKIIDSTDNMIKVLCPKFVELIVKDDFYKRFNDSLDENKKLKVKKFLDIDNEKEKI